MTCYMDGKARSKVVGGLLCKLGGKRLCLCNLFGRWRWLVRGGRDLKKRKTEKWKKWERHWASCGINPRVINPKSKMADEDSEVELGFIEKPENSLSLTSPFFPSKVGGKPSWLHLENLPPSQLLSCKMCKKQMIFLLQVYAPVHDDPRCFHRTVFVFCCKDGKCHKKSSDEAFLALRSQLPRKNKFYSSTAPPELVGSKLDSQFRPRNSACLCETCGCLGDKKCSKCHAVSYCCRDHQVFDWKAGHRKNCSKLAEESASGKVHGTENILAWCHSILGPSWALKMGGGVWVGWGYRGINLNQTTLPISYPSCHKIACIACIACILCTWMKYGKKNRMQILC